MTWKCVLECCVLNFSYLFVAVCTLMDCVECPEGENTCSKCAAGTFLFNGACASKFIFKIVSGIFLYFYLVILQFTDGGCTKTKREGNCVYK